MNMNKIEIELTTSLIKLEQNIAKTHAYHSNNLTQALVKNMEEFRTILFKLLMSNAEEDE